MGNGWNMLSVAAFPPIPIVFNLGKWTVLQISTMRDNDRINLNAIIWCFCHQKLVLFLSKRQVFQIFPDFESAFVQRCNFFLSWKEKLFMLLPTFINNFVNLNRHSHEKDTNDNSVESNKNKKGLNKRWRTEHGTRSFQNFGCVENQVGKKSYGPWITKTKLFRSQNK